MTVSPTRQDLERILRRFISDGTGLARTNVIPGDSNGPAKNDQYATLKLINSTQVGIDSTTYTDIDGDDVQVTGTTAGWRLNTYSVQVFRGDAFGTCATFRQYPHTPDGELYMQGNNFSWAESKDIIDINAITSGKNETRVSMEISIRYKETVVQLVNRIATVPLGIRETAETDLLTDAVVDGAVEPV